MEDTGENIKSKAVKGVAWSFVGNSANRIIQFVISLILARLLTPADYGLIGMIGVFMGLANTFIDSGFSSALIQYKDRSNVDYCTVFYVNFGMSLLMYGLLAVSAPWIADFYNEPRLVAIIRVYCLTLIIGSLAAINGIILTIDLNFKKGTIISTVSALLSAGVGLIFAFTGFGVWALVFQQLAASLIRCVLLLYMSRWFPSLVFSVKSFKRLFSFGSKLLASGLLHTVYSNLYPLIIGKKFSAADLGYVSRAQGFNDIIASNLTSVLTSAAFPILSKIQDDDERLLRAYSGYIRMSAFTVFPLVLFLCGVAKPLILFLLTEKWAPSIPLMQILSFSYLWLGIVQINLNLLYVKGRSDLVFRLEIIKKSIAIGILIITTIIGNLTIMCLGMTFYSFIALYLNTIYTKRLLNYGFMTQIKQIWPYLFYSLIIMAEGLFFSWLIDNSLLSLVVSSIVCMTTYFALCYITKQYALVQTVDIVAPKLGRFGQWLQMKVCQ
jgi:teichuronic acid exporter